MNGRVVPRAQSVGIAKDDRDQAAEECDENSGSRGEREPSGHRQRSRLAGRCRRILAASFTDFEVRGDFDPARRIERSIQPGEEILVVVEMRGVAQNGGPESEGHPVETVLPRGSLMSRTRGAGRKMTSDAKDIRVRQAALAKAAHFIRGHVFTHS
jgi:hypothetical protein